jgi:long-chain acyl-CoA synthetase
LHVCESAQRYLPLRESDVFLSFLPMSHVYERIAGQCLPVYLGASIAYAKNLASIPGDMQKVRPTIMLCVPRFLEAFSDRALDAVSKMPALRRMMFHAALSQGVKKARGEFAPLADLLDKLVMKKVRDRTGGRMRFFVSGGAALAPHVGEFFMGTGLTVLQGYGLTETAGGTCINRVETNQYWTVGQPMDMEVRIAEDGEVLVRGDALMAGYYNLPEETAKVIDADGWLHTGDIGEFEGKNLKITDRKKDIIVLGNGKNVAPQPVENKLKESPLITEAVLFGDEMDAVVALIVPNYEALRAEIGVDEGVKLSQSAEARARIKREIDAINKTLAPFQMVKRHTILDRPFSIETGELTPSMKVRRKVVRDMYAGQIEAMR